MVCALLRGGGWLVLLPAALPFLNFSPWTGWHVFQEFDILVLGNLAGAYLRLTQFSYLDWTATSHRNFEAKDPFERLLDLLRAAMFCSLVSGLVLGIHDAGGWRLNWFAGYVDPLNSVRVFKAGALSFLFIPLLRHEIARDYKAACHLLCAGVIAGLTGTVGVLLWERSAYPGLLDFSTPYRTVALFWEMHLGGAAIDAYLVLTAPFALWALMTSRSRIAWYGAAALVILCVYAWLTTFSRGVYVAIVVPLLALVVCLNGGWKSRAFMRAIPVPAPGWQKMANRALMSVVLAEVIAVMVGSTYLRERMSDADRDWGGRIRHWEQGIALLDGPRDWLWGKGLGRFPANYSRHAPEDEFSGALEWIAASATGERSYVRLKGPILRQELAGRFRLTQRVGRLSEGSHTVYLSARASTKTELMVSLCEKHLLYEAGCQRATIQVPADTNHWQTTSAPLMGSALGRTPWYAPRFGELSIAVANAGASVDIAGVRVDGLDVDDSIQNASFSDDTSHWFYSGRSYFLPWHIDNLYLEVLIEQGAIGLLLFGMFIFAALYCLAIVTVSSGGLAPYVACAIFATSLLGMVSSFMDMPRVAMLFWLFLHFGHESRRLVR